MHGTESFHHSWHSTVELNPINNSVLPPDWWHPLHFWTVNTCSQTAPPKESFINPSKKICKPKNLSLFFQSHHYYYEIICSFLYSGSQINSPFLILRTVTHNFTCITKDITIIMKKCNWQEVEISQKQKMVFWPLTIRYKSAALYWKMEEWSFLLDSYTVYSYHPYQPR
jgi:hypothetical protein